MAPINMLLHKQMVQVNLLAVNSITLETVGGLHYTVVTVVTVWSNTKGICIQNHVCNNWQLDTHRKSCNLNCNVSPTDTQTKRFCKKMT